MSVILRNIFRFLGQSLFRNVTPKLMALAMAVALWIYAYSFSYVAQTPLRVPLKIFTSSGWSLVDPSANSIEITFSYPRRFENLVEQARQTGQIRVECTVVADEAGTDQQPVNLTLTESSLVAPSALGLKAVSFSPAKVTAQLTRETTRSLRVEAAVSAPPPGYEVAFKYTIPQAVAVRGRKDVIGKARSISTEEIDITAPLPANMPDWQLSPTVRIAPDVMVDDVKYPVNCDEQVQCRIVLVQKTKERNFADVPIDVLAGPNYPHLAVIKPDAAKTEVIVSGRSDIVDAIKSENIVLYVDVRGLTPSDSALSLPIHSYVTGVSGAANLAVKLPQDKTSMSVIITAKPVP